MCGLNVMIQSNSLSPILLRALVRHLFLSFLSPLFAFLFRRSASRSAASLSLFFPPSLTSRSIFLLFTHPSHSAASSFGRSLSLSLFLLSFPFSFVVGRALSLAQPPSGQMAPRGKEAERIRVERDDPT